MEEAVLARGRGGGLQRLRLRAPQPRAAAAGRLQHLVGVQAGDLFRQPVAEGAAHPQVQQPPVGRHGGLEFGVAARALGRPRGGRVGLRGGLADRRGGAQQPAKRAAEGVELPLRALLHRPLQLQHAGAGRRVPALEVRLQAGERHAGNEGREPEREPGRLHRGRVDVHAEDAALHHRPPQQRRVGPRGRHRAPSPAPGAPPPPRRAPRTVGAEGAPRASPRDAARRAVASSAARTRNRPLPIAGSTTRRPRRSASAARSSSEATSRAARRIRGGRRPGARGGRRPRPGRAVRRPRARPARAPPSRRPRSRPPSAAAAPPARLAVAAGVQQHRLAPLVRRQPQADDPLQRPGDVVGLRGREVEATRPPRRRQLVEARGRGRSRRPRSRRGSARARRVRREGPAVRRDADGGAAAGQQVEERQSAPARPRWTAG